MQTSRELIFMLIITTTLLILVLVIFFAALLYFYQKKRTAYYESLNTLKTNYEKNLLSTQLEIQEETQQNISREIHDNIGLALTLAKLNLNTISTEELELAKEKINQSIELIGTALQDLRNISRSLNSELITNQGLIKAIEEEISRIKRSTTIKVAIHVSGEIRYLDTHKELLLFRIIQEALNNTIKHSQATKIKIELLYLPTRLRLSVSDNGKGFNIEKPECQKGSGLSNIQARTKIIKGEYIIESNNNGTRITIIIPY